MGKACILLIMRSESDKTLVCPAIPPPFALPQMQGFCFRLWWRNKLAFLCNTTTKFNIEREIFKMRFLGSVFQIYSHPFKKYGGFNHFARLRKIKVRVCTGYMLKTVHVALVENSAANFARIYKVKG